MAKRVYMLAMATTMLVSMVKSDCCYPDDVGTCSGADKGGCTSRTAMKSGCSWKTGTDDCAPLPGCCRGIDSACSTTSMTTCAKNARKKGCEWITGTADSLPDCSDPTPEPGCCAGGGSCDGADDTYCSGRSGSKAGCDWLSGVDADCTPQPGCCYGTSSLCWDADQSYCGSRTAKKAGCSWILGTTDSPPDCTPPTPEPGCCAGGGSCQDATDSWCTSRSGKKAGCNWESGADADCSEPTKQPTNKPTTALPTIATPQPTHDPDGCDHRHRRSWSSLSNTERQLYIDGFQELAKRGITQLFTETHIDSSEHGNDEFLPWHREYIWQLETAIRDLGGAYKCFTLPYWDWSDEPTPYDVDFNSLTLFITASGLGGDGDGQCLTDDVWGEGHYVTEKGECLERDLDYPDEGTVCTWSTPAEVMDVILKDERYKKFRSALEGKPHAYPHICIGGDASGAMATYNSPDDPIFYLHHCFVDYIWALWQDCHNYDGANVESDSDEYYADVDYLLQYDPQSFTRRVRDTFDIVADFDVSYEKGAFWTSANVAGDCGSGNINGAWFYNLDEAEEEFASANSALASVMHADEDGSEAELECDHRSSEEASQDIFKNLRTDNPDWTRQELVHEWAKEVCYWEQALSYAAEGACVPGDDFYACDDLEIRDGELDIRVTKAEMVNDPNRSQCQIDSVNLQYDWAKQFNQLQFLCRGCMDPFCDRDFLVDADLCPLNSNEHTEDEEAVFAQAMMEMVRSAGSTQVNALAVFAVAMVLVMALFAVKKCLLSAKKTKVAEGAAVLTEYGATVF